MAAELAVSKTAGGESPGRELGAGQEDPALPPLAVWPLLGVDSGLGRPLWHLEAVGGGVGRKGEVGGMFRGGPGRGFGHRMSVSGHFHPLTAPAKAGTFSPTPQSGFSCKVSS